MIKRLAKSTPIFSAIAAVSIDGKIAAHARHFSSWTSTEDKAFLHKMLDRSDVVVVGNNTYKTARKPLSKRTCIVFTRSVRRAVEKNSRLLYVNPATVDVRALVRKLGYKKISVLGGAQTYTYFLEHNLLREIYLTIEPVVFGTGISLFARQKFKLSRFALVSVKKLNTRGSMLLRYRAKRYD